MAEVKNIQARLTPKFLKGDISVKEGSFIAEYPKSLISAGGVYGLRWPPLVPAKHYGKVLPVKVHFTVEQRSYSFEVPALVTRELSMRSERMGLIFQFPQKELKEKIAKIIDQYGHTPVSHTRKYPRIPSQQFMDKFKLHANGLALPSVLNPTPQRLPYRIGNLSPEGMLLLTTQDEARHLRPGDMLDLAIQSNTQTQNTEIKLKGRIFRCMQEVTPDGEQFSLGIQISRIEEATKKAYFELLEKILRTIQSQLGL